MAWKQKFPNQCTLLSNCNTDLVERMCEAFPSEFHYSGNRAVSLDLATDVPEFPTRAVVAMALTIIGIALGVRLFYHTKMPCCIVRQGIFAF